MCRRAHSSPPAETDDAPFDNSLVLHNTAERSGGKEL